MSPEAKDSQRSSRYAQPALVSMGSASATDPGTGPRVFLTSSSRIEEVLSQSPVEHERHWTVSSKKTEELSSGLIWKITGSKTAFRMFMASLLFLERSKKLHEVTKIRSSTI